MDINDIIPGQCYRLVTGKIVRVKTIEQGIARCDIFRHTERTWISGASFTGSLFDGQCDDPASDEPKEETPDSV